MSPLTQTEVRTKLNLAVLAPVAVTLGGLAFLASAGWFVVQHSTNSGLPNRLTCATDDSFYSLEQRDNRAVAERLMHRTQSTQALLRAWKAKARNDRRIAKQLQAALQQRRQDLVASAAVDPGIAVQYLLTDNERRDATLLTNGCIEEPVSVTGTVSILHTHLENERAVNQYILEDTDGQIVELFLANAPVSLKSGDRINVRGVRVGRSIIADADTSTLAEGQSLPDVVIEPVQIATATTRKLLTALYYFPELSDVPNSPPSDAVPVATVNDWLFSASRSDSVKSFYSGDSYGALGIAGDTFGWMKLDFVPTTCAVVDANLVSAVLQKIYELNSGNPGFSFDGYTDLVLIGTYRDINRTGCNAGRSTIGRVAVHVPPDLHTVYMSEQWWQHNEPLVNASGISHELGHGLNWGHANFMNCSSTSLGPSGCVHREYGDIMSVMGSTGNYAYNNAVLKEYQGWLAIDGDPATQHAMKNLTRTNMPANGQAEFTLKPLGSQLPGLKAMKIQRSRGATPDDTDYMYIEYRQPIGQDNKTSGYALNYYEGAVIHTRAYLMDIKPYHSYLIDATATINPPTLPRQPNGPADPALLVNYINPDTGQHGLLDPATGTVIEVLENHQDTNNRNNSFLRARVTLGNDFDFNTPVVNVTTPAIGQDISGTAAPIVASITDDFSGIKQVTLTATVGAQTTTLATFTEPTRGTLSGTYQTTLDTLHIPNGPISISVQADDFLGNVSTVSRSVQVANTETIPPTVSISSPTPETVLLTPVPTEPVSVTADASDNTAIWKVEFFLDGSESPQQIVYTSPYTAWVNVSGSYGPHTLTVKAYDFALNTAVASVPVILRNQNEQTPPTASVTSPPNDSQFAPGTVVTIGATTADSAGIQSLEFFANGVSLSSYRPGTSPQTYSASYAWNTTSVPLGAYAITAKAWDINGNYALSAPVNVTITCIRANPWVGVDSGSSPYGKPGETKTYTLSINNNDSVGCDPSTFTVTGALPEGWTQTPVSQNLTVNPRGFAQTTFTLTAPLSLADGDYAITETAVNSGPGLSGFQGSDTADFFVDTTPPVVTISSPTEGTKLPVSGQITISGSAADPSRPFNVSSMQVSVDGQVFPCPPMFCRVTWTFGSTTTPGNHRITASATDWAGNTGSSSTVNVCYPFNPDGSPAGCSSEGGGDSGEGIKRR